MANQNIVSFDPMLKRLWYTKELYNESLKKNPFHAFVSKQTDFTGDAIKLPLQYSDMQGISADFQTAQANITPAQYEAFIVTRTELFGVGRVNGDVIEAGRMGKGSFVNSFTNEVKSGKNGMTRQLAISQYRTKEGSIATLSLNSTVTATTFIVSLADSYNLERLQTLQVIDGNTGLLRAGGATMQIVKIDRSLTANTGLITVNSVVVGTQSAAVPDRIVVAGNFNRMTSGLADWIPDVAPTSTPFFGVDRTLDVTRLGGLRFPTSSPIEEAIQDALAIQNSAGASPDKGFMNPVDYGNFVNALGSKVVRTKLMNDTGVGFSGVTVDSPCGQVDMVADVNCPRGKIYLLQMDTWTYASLGEAPHILDYGDGTSLRVGNQDAQEFRMGVRGQLMCSAPGYNQVVLLGQ